MTRPADHRTDRWRDAALVRVGVGLTGWGLAYALYRAYYAAGGTNFLPGTLADPSRFRTINAVAVVILLIAAALPIAMLPLLRGPRGRAVPLALCWLIAVGCVVHALVDGAERVLSLAGRLRIDYPASVWASVNHRVADLQDLLFNEPWFLIEGLGFATLGAIALGPGERRRWWIAAAVGATLALTVVGLLSATGVIGKVIIG
jgi:hypothetical protein